jgi:C4-dicarboxylate transporter DctM subunit
MTIALILGGLVILLFTGLPIFAGLTLFGGALLLLTQGELGSVSEVIFGEMNRYLLVAIPLFAFMAHVMIRARIVDDLYGAAYALTRHLPGGLGIATIAACTVFAAISGSSVATALTIGAVAIPQMIRFGYEPRMAYGLVAAGGTLGILIPPSGPLVLYGVVTNSSIGGLFMAGVIPGLMIGAIFVAWNMASTARSQRNIPREPRASLREAATAVRKSGWALSLPVFVLGGMYAGVFTATEAAAAGAIWRSASGS